jgi:hemerythrin-like domain-containing protein
MDIHLRNPVEDAELTRSLADVMGHLRAGRYGVIAGHLEEALQGSGNVFIDTLARHLLYEEQVLFPELRHRDPGKAEQIRTLQAEHAQLRDLATRMACAIKSGKLEEAYAVARTFLAELYSHIDRESEVTDQAHP